MPHRPDLRTPGGTNGGVATDSRADRNPEQSNVDGC